MFEIEEFKPLEVIAAEAGLEVGRLPDISDANALVGREAFDKFLEVLGLNTLNREFWFDVAAPGDPADRSKKGGYHCVFQGFYTNGKIELVEWKKDKKTGKWNPTNRRLKDAYSFFYQEARLGRDIFYRANFLTDGICDNNFRHSTDLFFEFDHETVPKQWELINQFAFTTGVKPTAIVHSGGKSLHVHFRTPAIMDGNVWKDAMNRLAAFVDSDPAVCTLSRLMRLAGFPRKGKDGTFKEVSLAYHDASAQTTAEEVVRATKEHWPFPFAFSDERWAKYKGACLKQAKGESLAPLSVPSDAFRLSESKLLPKTETYTSAGGFDESSSQNGLVQLLEEELRPRLRRLPLEEQYSQFDHNFKQMGSELVGRSPFSKTNNTGTAFKVNTKTGQWYCHSSLQGGDVETYLKLLWFDDRKIRGKDFKDYCFKLAGILNVPIPDRVLNWKPDPNKKKATPPTEDGFPDFEEEQGGEYNPLRSDYLKIKRQFGDRCRLNQLKQSIELDGKPFSIGTAKLKLAIDYQLSLDSSKEDVADMVAKLAEENAYSPVVEYLEECYKRYGDDISILDKIAQRHFGIDHALYDTFVLRFLIGAVARAFQPGCKLDTVLILQGPQGYQKSSWFKHLANPGWFDDSMGKNSDKDERMKLHFNWILEWAEVEALLKRRETGEIKAFLSCAEDNLRRPYAREIEALPRRSVIVASSNQEEFLGDSTGNRRFWVVPVKRRIDVQMVQEERDRIWAAAVALYKAGEQWWLTDLEQAGANQVTERYATSHPWLPLIQAYLGDKDVIQVSQILAGCIQMEAARQEKRHQMEVSDILKQLGWTRDTRRLEGKPTKVWVKPTLPDSLPPFPPNPDSGNEEVTSETPAVLGSSSTVTTVTTFLEGKSIEREEEAWEPTETELEMISEKLGVKSYQSDGNGGNATSSPCTVDSLGVTTNPSRVVTGSGNALVPGMHVVVTMGKKPRKAVINRVDANGYAEIAWIPGRNPAYVSVELIRPAA